MPQSHLELDVLIKERAFTKLVGELETEFFDAKGEPYKPTEAGKLALSCDALAFANASDGGCIILGMRTEQVTSSRFDRVVELRPFSEALVDTKQYLQLIESSIFPQVTGVTVRWLQPDGVADDNGLVVIDIPRQSHAPSYLLVKTFDPGTGKQLGNLYGHLQRSGDRNVPLSVADMHRYFMLGMHYEKLERRLDGIEDLLAQGLSEQQATASLQEMTELVDQRIQDALNFGALRGNPSFVLAAVPEPASTLRTVFDSHQGSVRFALEHATYARANGWNLSTLSGGAIHKAEAIRTNAGDFKVIYLYRDGVMILAAAADERYMGIGPYQNIISYVAVIELVIEFMRFYVKVTQDAATPPKRLRFRAEFHDMGNEPRRKLQYYPQGALNSKVAPDHTLKSKIDIELSSFVPERTAYDLVREIYLSFGVDPDKIVSAVHDQDGWRIDFKKLVS